MYGINTRVGQLLHEDHLNTIAALQRLEQFLARQGLRNVPLTSDEATQKILRDVTKIVADEVGRHFGFEETHLFPALAEAGESGMTEFLMEEHASILPIAERCAELAKQAMESGFTEESWKNFHQSGMELVEREVFHIQKEEMGLLAAIGALIDAEADFKLSEAFGAFTGR